MNKTELIGRVAEQTGSSEDETRSHMEAFTRAVAETLKEGEEVRITGFGRFYVRERAAREGVNPQTGKKMEIQASKVPSFSAGAGLKGSV